ncbi:MAG TPA: hypothetical protein VOA88_11060 [Candidatus Dormibacteraeota bacterium]|nr:hypothetical protein [Candidatus Dormibacteraeota bacterium]
MARKLSKKKLGWIVGIIISVLAVLSPFFVPEIRSWLGLKNSDNPTNIGISSGPNSPNIQDNKGPVTVNPGEASKHDEQKNKQGDKK